MSTGRRRKSGSSSRRVSSKHSPRKKVESGQRASRVGLELQSYEVGVLPLVNALLDRMRLAEILAEHLPPDDPRTELPTVSALLVLLRNVLSAREPIYGVAEWAARFAPDLLDLWDDEVALLHDDRLGRCLDRLFASAVPEMILAVVRHVIGEFDVGLDELHNDSTTVSFYGAYEEATKEGRRHGRVTPAITWGHSKDHRPDLKQLLYTLDHQRGRRRAGVLHHRQRQRGGRPHALPDLGLCCTPWSGGRSFCTWPTANWPAARI